MRIGLDGVSDRDFCIELGSALSILMMHLSRFSEEIVPQVHSYIQSHLVVPAPRGVETLSRGRLADTYKRMNVMPLGSGALASTTYPIDRRQVSAMLGFDDITQNRYILISRATWSFLLLAVWRRFPVSPRRSVRTCSTNIWISSAFGSTRKLP